VLVCWDCQNLQDFVQVSHRGDHRTVTQHPGGPRPGPWTELDDREPGLYCARCDKPIDAEPGALDLVDDRLDFVDPADFDADACADRLELLRPDATWTRLELPERPPRFAPIPDGLHPAIVDALSRTGRSRLFTHQTDAIATAMLGKHVIQATPAGSGKSLGLTLPVLNKLLRRPASTAVLVFPLRALANDQLAALGRLGTAPVEWLDTSSFDLRLSDDVPPIRVSNYIGGTPAHERREVRRRARLVVTTPDSLHGSILRMATKAYADGTSWERLLRNLEFVVLDELHSYQGVFGSAVGNVLRRLRRVCHHYGASPTFLTASATIGNPVELAESLTGVSPFHLVRDDGSVGRRRVVLVCNPPARTAEASSKAQATKKLVDPEDAEAGRIAPQTIAIDVLAHGALANETGPPVRSITFCRSRNAVFQLAQRTRAVLQDAHRGDLAPAVAPYAATFTSDDRQEAEGKLRDGSTLAIVSTSALELGIDIPDLSVAVLVGYPGQISSFRQRVGRAGRAGEGLGVLIVGDDPLQQYLARDPEALRQLLDAPAESVIVNPSAPEIVRRFGLSPAQEELGGVAFEDEQFFGPAVRDWLARATGAPAVTHSGVPYWHLGTDGDPHAVGLRNAVGSDRYTVLNQSGRDFQEIGVIDGGSAPRDAFVPAIWNGPGGELYRVTGFDQAKHLIYCQGPIESPFLTRGISADRVEVLAPGVAPADVGAATVGYGQLAITRQVFNYKEQHFSGVEVNHPVQVGWPPVDFRTDGLYLRIDTTGLGELPREGSVRALEHLLLSVAPALVACDPYDIESTCTVADLYLYDSFGGDLGLTRPLFDRMGELFRLAHDVVTSCPCEAGCPSCVMLSRRPDGNQELSKAGAVRLLDLMLTVEA
jgi:DEAD/DEAH box helicase domain-containing protein